MIRNMNKRYDVIVIGTGSAGSTVASRCRSAGWSVAIIDNRPFGGTCALRGCDPKKILVGAADLIDWTERMRSRDIIRGKSQIDWAELMKFKHTFTDPHPIYKEKSFAEAGVEAFHGTARFTGRNLLQATMQRKLLIFSRWQCATGWRQAI